MVSRRVAKISAQLQVLASKYFLREKNSKVTVIVADVDVSADMKRATVWYALEFGKLDESELIRLQKGLQKYYAKNLEMRSTPKVELKFDVGLKHTEIIDELLKNNS